MVSAQTIIFFMAMFLICLPPSLQEAVSAENRKTALAMVRAADAL
jgi:hypothetical protein